MDVDFTYVLKIEQDKAPPPATLRIRPAGSLPDPVLTVGVMDLLMPHFEFNRSDFTEVDAELSQEIPWPGSLGGAIERTPYLLP